MPLSNRGPVRPTALAAAIVTAIGAASASGVAGAQDSEDAQAGTQEVLTVTGSRIRRDDFTSPQPTIVMDSEYLESIGVINAGQAMIVTPQNVNRNSPEANAGGNFFNGSTLANLRGLNPFFGTRTLTLVDSRRHVPTNQGDGVDLNFIPTILIDRIETVTGGASASYGSGAIGGVQNILLDRDFEGFKASINFGSTAEGDGDSTQYGFAFGTAVGDNGNFVIGFEGEDSDGVAECPTARSWCANGTDIVNRWSGAPAGTPAFSVENNVTQAWNSNTGVFWLPGFGGRTPNDGSIVPGVLLNSDGDGLLDFDPGVGGDDFFRSNAIGGDGEHIYEGVWLRSPIERQVLYAAYEGMFSDTLGFTVEASLANSETDTRPTRGDFSTVTDNVCIQPDNAYIQPSIVGNSDLLDFVTANSGAFPCVFGGVPLMKDWDDNVLHGNTTDTDLARLTFGLNGQFADSTWYWDAYYQWGESEREQRVNNIPRANGVLYALDSVLDGSGQPACRSTVDPMVTTPSGVANLINAFGLSLANPVLAQGCQPLNPFGINTASQEALDYAFGFIRENTTVEQNMLEFVTSGDIASDFGAAPLRGAFGISFRSESLDNIAAEELGDALRRDFAIQYGDSFSGEVDVWELFAEFDLPIHERFEMNIAMRHSEYENKAGFGTRLPGASYDYDIDTWKVGASIEVTPTLWIRLSESHDIRAPNHRELYYGQVFTPGSFFGFIQPPFSNNPWTNTGSPDPTSATLFGGERNGIVPEEADTTTIGFVITPQNTNIRLAIDYFQIDLENSIAPANLGITIEGCFLGDQTFCDKITDGVTTPWQDPSVDHNGDPTGGSDSIPCLATCYIDIDDYFAETFNAGLYEVDGLDVSFDWLKTLPNGSFMLRMLGTRTFNQEVTIARSPLVEIPSTDIVGTVGNAVGFLSDYASAADISANVTATWQRGDFSLTGQMRYVHDGKIDRGRIGPDDPSFDPANPGTVTFNTLSDYQVYSLTGTYDFALRDQDVQFWGAIDNLTDEDPPVYGDGTGGTNAIFYNTIGRSYRVGMRFNF